MLRTALVTLIAVYLMVNQTIVFAQDVSPPSLPIIYNGTVFLDGEALEKQTLLTVRVGTWESRPVLVDQGSFQLLVAGPPGGSHDGELITFALGDLIALQQFVFTSLPEPKMEILRLDFQTQPIVVPAANGATGPVVTENNASTNDHRQSWPWWLGACIALLGATVLIVRRRAGFH